MRATPQRWCTYPGDVTEMVGQQLVGPNTLNEVLTPVVAVHDPTRNITRVGFAFGDHRTKAVPASHGVKR